MRFRLQLALLISIALGQIAHAEQSSAESQVIEASQQFDSAFDDAEFGSLAEILADDIIFTAGRGKWLSLEDALAFMKSLHERRPGITMATTPELVEEGPEGWGVVSERGRWTERWVENDKPNLITGSYQALWRHVDGRWRLAVLTLVPVECSGPYCAR